MSGSLSAAAESLLPDEDDAPRCADHQRRLGIDPGGTAIDSDLLVLIDTPLPWPAEMAAHVRFGGRGPEIPVAGGQARLLAVVPPRVGDGGRVRIFWRTGAAVRGRTFLYRDQADLDRILGQLQHVHPTDAPADRTVEASADLVLVCTHGSRDQCCGTDGTRLAATLTATRPDLVVERTSHLGGHRFSPTVMTLANGRMWADFTTDDVIGVLDRAADPASVAGRCRGWWGAPMGPAQMAERAVFAQLGWAFDDQDRRIETTALADGITRGIVTWAGGRRRVDVAVARQTPTIACRQPGGRPAKPSVEYAVVAGPTDA